MFNPIVLAVFISLFTYKIQRTQSSLIESIEWRHLEPLAAVASFNCFQKYFTFHFKEMGKVRFNVIQGPLEHGSQIEQSFLRTSNERFHNPTTLTTFASMDKEPRNYLIFLSSGDLADLKHIVIPNVPDESFLYIFYQRSDVNDSLSDIYSIFTPSFEQNIVIIATLQNSSGSEWIAFRVVLVKCMNSFKKYEMVTVSECRRDGFKHFPLTPRNTAECPIQVAGIHNPPFTYYDDSRGFYSGVEYYLIRLICERLKKPLNFTYLSLPTAAVVSNELFLRNSTVLSKNSAFVGQVENRTKILTFLAINKIFLISATLTSWLDSKTPEKVCLSNPSSLCKSNERGVWVVRNRFPSGWICGKLRRSRFGIWHSSPST